MGVVYDEDGHPHLHGYPEFCPVCMCNALNYRSMPDMDECHWYCEHCLTEWRVEDLIEALEEAEVENELPTM